MATITKVKSLKTLENDRVYTTTNYSLFTHAKFNRAEDDGFVEKKVDDFKRLILAGIFIKNLQEIRVTRNGIIWEGNNRYEALMALGLPIRFIISDEEDVNTDDESLIKILIAFNGVRTDWNAKQVFHSAVRLGLPFAVAIDNKIDELRTEHRFLNKSNFPESKLIGILLKDKDMIHGKKIGFDLLSNANLVEKMDDKDFISDLDFSIAVMKILIDKDSTAEPREIMTRIMKSVWNGIVSKEKIYHYISQHGFNTETKSAKLITKLINEYSLYPNVPFTPWN